MCCMHCIFVVKICTFKGELNPLTHSPFLNQLWLNLNAGHHKQILKSKESRKRGNRTHVFAYQPNKRLTAGPNRLKIRRVVVMNTAHRQSYLRCVAYQRSFFFFCKCCLRPQRPYGLLGTGSPGRPPRLSHSS